MTWRVSGSHSGTVRIKKESDHRITPEKKKLTIFICFCRRRGKKKRSEMSSEPPPSQETLRADVCKCGFNTFRRRALPQFGILTSDRVSVDCFSNSSGSAKADHQSSLGGVDYVTNGVSRLNIDAVMGSKTEATAEHQPCASIPDFKCGMPLCICESPAPITDALQPKFGFNPGLMTNGTAADKAQMDYDVNGEVLC
ncbi:hypothetical protein PTKIN_Ptkin03bG0217800 [Pterospermum kingtungense]